MHIFNTQIKPKQPLYPFQIAIPKMKKLILLIGLFFYCLNSRSQNLTINELSALCNKKNIEEVNAYLLKKGWKFHESSLGAEAQYKYTSWSFNKIVNQNKAFAWISLYSYEEIPNKVQYSFCDRFYYDTIKRSLVTSGLKKIKSYFEVNDSVLKYAGLNFVLTISAVKRDTIDCNFTENPDTIYSAVAVKKFGVFDDANGIKQMYDSLGNIEAEFTVKDGKIDGYLKSFYTNGKLQVHSTFINGVRQGISTEYDENGILIAAYNYLNDELNGPFKIYENNKLNMVGGKLNGVDHGQFKEYNEDNRIVKEYTMKRGVLDGNYTEYGFVEGKLLVKVIGYYSNGEKTGLWQTVKINEKGIDILESHTYVKGKEQGAFKRINRDSIFIGNYKNGLLDGSYRVYQRLTSYSLDALHGDTTKCQLIINGRYLEGQRSGVWKFYSMSKGLIKEGQYQQGLESGEWKQYFDNYVNDNGKPQPYSGKLRLIENYEHGIKNGKETIWGILEKRTIKCPKKVTDNFSPMDTCFKMVYQRFFQTSYYKNGALNGSFERKDSNDLIISKGNYINGKKDGLWLESRLSLDSALNNYYTFLRGKYADGMETGVWEEFIKEDFINVTNTYLNGKLNGKTTNYNNYKKPKEEKYFEDGKLKTFNIYDSLGANILRSYEILAESDYEFKCRKTTFNQAGRIVQEYTLRKNNGKAINLNYFEFVFNLYTGIYSDGTLGHASGEYKMYDKNNRILVEGQMHKNMKIGLWKNYYYDNNIYSEQAFKDNVGGVEKFLLLNSSRPFNGKFVQNYENGKPKYKFLIFKGLREGKSKYYSEMGNLIKTENYKNGILTK